METKKFETLFCLDKRNKMKQWDIKVENNNSYSEIIVVYGGVDARKIETRTKISKGKNIGKKNETTHFQQAIKDAQSKWNKKRDLEGYKVTGDYITISNNDGNIEEQMKDLKIKSPNKKSKKESVGTSTVSDVNRQGTSKSDLGSDPKFPVSDPKFPVSDPKFPMLAQDYFKQKSKLKFPCFMQPKLDGYRMIYENGKCTSRQGKEFDIIKETSLFKELQSIKSQQGIILDGELYIHGGTFEHLGILRKKKLLDSDKVKLEQIEYHVYDIIDTNKTFKERNNILKEFIKSNSFKKIKLVKTLEIENENTIKSQHLDFVNDNYEGSIIRNMDGKYRCKFRSTDLLKYKDFEDAEYPIVNFTFEKDTSGDGDHLIVWVCKTKDGNDFSIRPKGTHEERKELFKECNAGKFDKYKGRNLWVKYFELTDRNIPRFPTTKTDTVSSYIRDTIE
jgi:ATP-dependent DNA ligase